MYTIIPQFFCVCIIVCRRVARQTSNAYISIFFLFSNLSKSSNLNQIRSLITCTSTALLLQIITCTKIQYRPNAPCISRKMSFWAPENSGMYLSLLASFLELSRANSLLAYKNYMHKNYMHKNYVLKWAGHIPIL